MSISYKLQAAIAAAFCISRGALADYVEPWSGYDYHHGGSPPAGQEHIRREIVIPEQRYVFDEVSDDLNELKHLLELADLVAYENSDNSNGEHVIPSYIGRHNALLNLSE